MEPTPVNQNHPAEQMNEEKYTLIAYSTKKTTQNVSSIKTVRSFLYKFLINRRAAFWASDKFNKPLQIHAAMKDIEGRQI